MGAEIQMFTDGACRGNPGPGGYGVVIQTPEGTRTLSGGFRSTTNNRMELMAVIAGLEAAGEGARIRLFTDSKYVADAINLGWAARWRKNGWKRNKSDYAENTDLWEKALTLLAERTVRVEWVRGHAGNRNNNTADRLAVAASHAKHLEVDTGFEGWKTIRKAPTLSD